LDRTQELSDGTFSEEEVEPVDILNIEVLPEWTFQNELHPDSTDKQSGKIYLGSVGRY